MSATLSNMAEVAQFLKAEVYTNNFRPVGWVILCDSEDLCLLWVLVFF